MDEGEIMFKQGNEYPTRFWECKCCGSLLVTLKRDDASRYQCPQCHIVKCTHDRMYVEITINEFCAAANITVY